MTKWAHESRKIPVAVLAFAILLASACSSRDDSDSYATVDLTGGLPFESESDVVTYGDFAATFRVVGERDFSNADIDPPADGSPVTYPPDDPSAGYVGRVITIEISEVAWDSKRVDDIPSNFEFVDLGWQIQDGKRVPAVSEGGVRIQTNVEYFGVFASTGRGLAPMGPDSIYEVADGHLTQPGNVADEKAAELDLFEGETVQAASELLSAAQVHDYALPFMDDPAAIRAAKANAVLAEQVNEEPGVSNSTP